jgi:hypothetical protein
MFAGQFFMQAGGTGDLPFAAPAAEIKQYFDTRDPAQYAVGAYLEALGLLALLWFVCGLYALLRRHAPRHDWLPAVVLASGAAAVGAVLHGAAQAAAFRAGVGLDPQLARLAFDQGNLTFANMWLALGSLSLASGWSILATRAEPAWLGWWALVAGVGFLASRIVWTTTVWLVPYGLFWVWVLVVATRMLRPARQDGHTPH